ncbi:DUF4279 domain-containing protein [Nonomuraea phyllanthi]|uniref:DUF4279 domain-containing protein n=1 Tax=Nonomuraea phyllanthi TaxID=2219224 RepID=UPI001292ED56|nr:DUF4279 domain-containing protein [Nonomuraea phyllanthi]QFY05898.1 DUF4279 domain-containing protein [Nonomuraea phyllanthi]
MRVRQYVYFAMKSDILSAVEMSARIGLEPDEAMVQGRRSRQPLRPAMHVWKIACRDPGLTVDEMISRVVDRLEPFSEAVGGLVEELNRGHSGSCAVLQVVRYYGDEEGEVEDLRSPDPAFEKVPGQHQLLGWHLDGRVLRFLVSARAELDVDEYG